MSLEIGITLGFSATQPQLNKLKMQGTNYLKSRSFLSIALKCIELHSPMYTFTTYFKMQCNYRDKEKVKNVQN